MRQDVGNCRTEDLLDLVYTEDELGYHEHIIGYDSDGHPMTVSVPFTCVSYSHIRDSASHELERRAVAWQPDLTHLSEDEAVIILDRHLKQNGLVNTVDFDAASAGRQVELVVACLRCRDQEKWENAVDRARLLGLAAKIAIPDLDKVLKTAKSPRCRGDAAETLGKLGHVARHAVESLRFAITFDFSEVVRSEALRALGSVDPDDRVKRTVFTQVASNDGDRTVRAEALELLQTLGRSEN